MGPGSFQSQRWKRATHLEAAAWPCTGARSALCPRPPPPAIPSLLPGKEASVQTSGLGAPEDPAVAPHLTMASSLPAEGASGTPWSSRLRPHKGFEICNKTAQLWTAPRPFCASPRGALPQIGPGLQPSRAGKVSYGGRKPRVLRGMEGAQLCQGPDWLGREPGGGGDAGGQPACC